MKKGSTENLESSSASIEESLNGLQARITQFLEQLSFHKKNLRKEKQRKAELKQKISDIQQAQEIVNKLAEKVQSTIHDRIANVVTKCLQTVYADHPDGPYEFKIKLVKRRNKTEASLVFVRNGEEIPPLEASGGGPIDIASFALRLACILCSRPMLRRVIVLDEPFKNLDKDVISVAAQLIMELAKETKTQIILVTHIQEIKVGSVIQIE